LWPCSHLHLAQCFKNHAASQKIKQLAQKKNAISLAVIKRRNAQMAHVKKNLKKAAKTILVRKNNELFLGVWNLGQTPKRL
jgi:TorA maturation chaperone TorD